MSTFAGKLAEVPGATVDRFDGANLESKAFFLSHCHQDHMVGLAAPFFQRRLVEHNLNLYLTNVSGGILRRLHPAIAPQLKELDLFSSTTVDLGDASVSVTPIPAGHCPGSVMFLFETDDNKTVLYTGDYRIRPSDLPKFKAFYDSFNQLKIVDKVYLDTTFFLKSYLKFPSRSESLDEICRIIRAWISKGPKHVVDLSTSAKYGYEYLFIEVYNQLGMPVHVNDEVFEFYSLVPEMDGAVTRSADDTQVHCACGLVYTDICKNAITFKVKTVRVSAWRWQNQCLENGISEDRYGRTDYVCYSTHASYHEGVQLLKFLKPKAVEPSVLHKDDATNREIYANIEEVLAECRPPEVEDRPGPKLFDVCIEIDSSSDESGQDTGKPSDLPEDLSMQSATLRSILDSPPRKRTK